MKRRNMCPNAECDRYGVETGLMGGCECGSALVRFKTAEEEIDAKLNDLFSDSYKRLTTYFLLGSLDRDRREP